ncbi:hypothetical protein SAY86_007791 [Trapa natans]|uniref:Uncharacterized protein n=1 Tax=Trapa natans TaxID=22666 RepID=A0AAN7LBI6_TRANT|nr:hypothetical protein SAY86_007791 [Trapa natans]
MTSNTEALSTFYHIDHDCVLAVITLSFTSVTQPTSFAALQRSPTQALVIGIRTGRHGLQLAAHRDFPTQLVGAEVQHVQLTQSRQLPRNSPRELVIVHVQESELLELAEGRWDRPGKVEVVQPQEIEPLQLAQYGGDRASDVGQVVQVDHLEVGKISDGIGDLAGELCVEDGELVDAVVCALALDTVPAAAVGAGP